MATRISQQSPGFVELFYSVVFSPGSMEAVNFINIHTLVGLLLVIFMRQMEE